MQQIFENIQIQHDKILASIKRIGDKLPELNEDLKLVSLFKESDDSLISSIFGPDIIKAKQTAHKIDFSHPDIVSLLSGSKDWLGANDIFTHCKDVMSLVQFARDNNMAGTTQASIKKMIMPNFTIDKFKQDMKLIESTTKRFILDPIERAKSREIKKGQTVGNVLANISSIELYLQSQPDDFSNYGRYSGVHDENLALEKIKLDHFARMGLGSVIKQRRSILETTTKKLEQKFQGFNVVSLVDVITILSKVMNYKYDSSSRRFVVNSTQFDIDAKKHLLDYHPKAYMLWELESILPTIIKDTIAYLEALPELGGRPAFDNYRVIVPSFKVDGVFNDQSTLHMLEKGQFVSVILGERNDSHFFINYWI